MQKTKWKEMFERADSENLKLYQEIVTYRLRELITYAVNQCDNNEQLKGMAVFCGNLVNMKFIDQGIDSYYEKTEEGKR